MNLELQYRINSDPRLKQFLRENSYWYKYLNRSNTYLKPFISDMKDKYKLKTTDKINKLTNNISMVRAFLDVLK